MEIAAKIVEAFETEKKRFLNEMGRELISYQLDTATKKQLYNNLVRECKSIDLKKMQVTDLNWEKPIEIQNTNDLLMAVGVYYTKIRNVFIKQFKVFQDPFKTIIISHEKKVTAILDEYI